MIVKFKEFIKDLRLPKNLSFSYVSQFLAIIFSIVEITVINQLFGLYIYGQYIIIISAISLTSRFTSFRNSDSVAIFYKSEKYKGAKGNTGTIILTGLLTDIFLALLLVLIIFLFSGNISTIFLKEENLSYLLIRYSIVPALFFSSESLNGYLLANNHINSLNYQKVSKGLFNIICLLLIAFLAPDKDLEWLIYAFIISSIIQFIFKIYLFLNKFFKDDFKYKFNTEFDMDLIKSFNKLNFKFFISSTLKIGYENASTLILSLYINPIDLGIYNTLRKLFLLFPFLSSPLSKLTFSEITENYIKKDFKKLNRIIFSYSKILLIFLLTISFLCLIIYKPYLYLQGVAEYDDLFIVIVLMIIHHIFISSIWWLKNFSINHKPSLPIITNLLLTINTVWISLILLELNVLKPLETISLAILLAYIPSWYIGLNSYLSFIKNKAHD